MHKRHAQTRQNQTRQTSLQHNCLNCWEIRTLRKDGKLLACFVCFWKKRAEGRLSAIFMYIKKPLHTWTEMKQQVQCCEV